MFDSLLSSVISIDGDFETIHFFSADEGAKNQFNHQVEVYKTKAFEGDFYEILQRLVKIHKEKTSGNNRVALVLPDNLFFTDTIKVPVVQKKALKSSLGVAVEAIYKNANELKYKTFLLSQNKQVATFGVMGARKVILNKTVSAIEAEGFSVAEKTFSASAMVRGAVALNPKIKSATYLLVDVKEKTTHIAMVISGKTVGFFTLPFGFSSFKDSVVNSETTLFDHLAADLLVLNAKEKAKKKNLTVVDQNDEDDELDEELSEGDEDSGDTNDSAEDRKMGALFKRVNRKLPKFMIRPTPETEQGFIYENFRPIVKWSLEILRNNFDITASAEPKNVFVNMPSEYSFVFDKLKEEEAENGIAFAPLFTGEVNPQISANLELYGGLYLKKFNKTNNI